MRFLLSLLFVLFSALPCAQAADPKAPPAPAGEKAMPVFMTVQPDAPKAPQVQKIEAPTASFEAPAYEFIGWWKRSPFMRVLVWYCAAMFAIAMVGLTVWSMYDARRRKIHSAD